MLQHSLQAFMVLVVFLSATSTVMARAPLSVELRTAMGYDSNVTVEQADVITRKGDALLTLGASAKYRLPSVGKLDMTAGYDFEQNFYEDLKEYNLQIHNLALSANTRFAKAGVSTDYRYFHMRLGNDPFLDMHMITPAIGSFVTRDMYMRVGYTYFDKDFALANRLDAQSHAADLGVYYFFHKKRSYAHVNGRYESESTRDPALAYDSLQISAKVQLATDSLLKNSKLRLGVAFRERNYRYPTLSIGVPRMERRYSFSVGAEIPLGSKFILKPEYRWADRNSNYIFTNYTEDTASIMLLYRY